ncbi:UDP-N-acetylmuramoylalanyl-D-glutamate--2,6-diaminopimelate ligase [Plesiocystis pacifica SIR-1]|uniref:UDP-N-acetylmuramoyl-L-alanyl-D-glutamate--2,6-diaminopimelate ligase n=2 Tax=Plesiocystis pacifica TaxID=191768 RepID=A6FZR0_9BACT|nr:UDP-N-acetylmuramoylalanyl-D-glutamate--2,6-diaminopimelate ligase [Plesiocystis pacifica SIR-1]
MAPLGLRPHQDAPLREFRMGIDPVGAGDVAVWIPSHPRMGLTRPEDALAQGAAAVLTDDRELAASDPRIVFVPALADEVSGLAASFYGHPGRALKVVAVTGTCGKTSTTFFTAQLADRVGLGAAVMGTLGMGRLGDLRDSGHTTPQHAMLQRELARYVDEGLGLVAIEASSAGLEMDRLGGVPIDAGVFTMLGRDHLDRHRTMEAYAAAKWRLFDAYAPEFAVLGADDPTGEAWARRLRERCAVTVFGAEPRPELDLPRVHIEGLEQQRAGLGVRLASTWGEAAVSIRALGAFQAHNLAAALATLARLGVPWPELVVACEGLSGPPGRMEPYAAPGTPLCLIDYAHTPESLTFALDSARALAPGGRVWCVFGCGGGRDSGKRGEMGAAAEGSADVVVVTTDNPRHEDPEAIAAAVVAGMETPSRARVIGERGQAITRALDEAAPEDVVVVAGKGHERVQIFADRRVEWSDRDFVAAYMGARGG